MNTQNLLHLISNDERGAFEQFYRHYYEQVFRFTLYFVKEKEICREVVADVFFAVWQSRKRLSSIDNIETYLYIIVRNESIRYLKRNNYSNLISLNEIPIQLEESSEISPEDHIYGKEIDKLLTRVINELPEKCRIIFLMAREEGLKSKQIAEILSLKESTVRVQMKIAIDKIVEAVRPHFPNLTLSLLFFHIFP